MQYSKYKTFNKVYFVLFQNPNSFIENEKQKCNNWKK